MNQHEASVDAIAREAVERLEEVNTVQNTILDGYRAMLPTLDDEHLLSHTKLIEARTRSWEQQFQPLVAQAKELQESAQLELHRAMAAKALELIETIFDNNWTCVNDHLVEVARRGLSL